MSLAEDFEAARHEEVTRRRGRVSESRALRVLLQSWPRPWWLLGARVATREEDLLGIDIVVEHADRRALWLQIKSSPVGAAKFAKHKPEGARIACVVVDAGEHDRALYGRLLAALILLREEMGL